MTEEEMKKLVCPWFHISQQINAIIQMQSSCFTKPASDKCAGSKCPMWRTHKITSEKYDKEVEGWVPAKTEIEGYCGLAGKP